MAEYKAPKIEAARTMGEKGGPHNEGERMAFEAWMRGHCWAISAEWDGESYRGKAENGEYFCPHAMRTRQLWAAWRDRAALSADPQPNVTQRAHETALKQWDRWKKYALELQARLAKYEGGSPMMLNTAAPQPPATTEQDARDAQLLEALEVLYDQAVFEYAMPADHYAAQGARDAIAAAKREAS